MPRAVVLNTASVASATGGTFADTLTINSPDSLAVANFDTGEAWIREAWAIDSAHAAEFQVIYTRPESTHDQSHGFRFGVPALALGGAGTNGAFNALPGIAGVKLFKSDSPTIQASCTASDVLVYSWVTEYDDLPGAAAKLATWDQVQSMRVSDVGIQVTAVANTSTAGLYGTARAFNADDNRLHANTWYAILGASVQTPVTTISLTGPDWGGQRLGMPAGSLDLRSNTWFLDQTIKWGRPLIPCFNSNNAGNVNVQVVNTATSTSPKPDFFLVELSGTPGA